jgi:hypothetical protein
LTGGLVLGLRRFADEADLVWISGDGVFPALAADEFLYAAPHSMVVDNVIVPAGWVS